MKHLLFCICIILCIIQSTQAQNQYQNFDFSSTAPSGQILYYKISGCSVFVTHPDIRENISHYYGGHQRPVGDLIIPDSVTHNGETYIVSAIDTLAFYYCNGLISVTIPSTISSIGVNAFSKCTSLTSIDIPSSVTNIGVYAFSQCSSLASITIPNSITEIDDYVFSQCSSLGLITIPNSIISIGDYAFYKCSSLTIVKIPNSVISIGESAFQDCYRVTNVILGNSLQSIAAYTFKGCSQLVRVKSFATTPPTIQERTFFGLSDNIIVNVPCGCGSVYENTAFWLRFNIQEDLLYSFSAISSDPSRGTVSVITYPSCENAEAEVEANAYHAYHFDHWNNGNTDNPRYIVVMQDTAIQAVFLANGETDGIEGLEDYSVKVYTSKGRIIVEGVDSKIIHVFDMLGREIRNETLPVGIYLVKIGNNLAKKVAVIR